MSSSSSSKRVKLCEDVRVELGDERTYPVVFSSIASIGQCLEEIGLKRGNCVLVSNSVVGQTVHKTTALDALKAAGWTVTYVEFIDGELHKTPETYLDVVSKLLEAKVDRKTLVIGLGGGVTTDIVGFACATVLRGLTFVNIPTTLLAMVDASVGGKTGVNTLQGKNLLGCFWQPKLVLVSPSETLRTLNDFEFNCGMGEVVKHAVLDEDGSFFEWLEANADGIATRDHSDKHYQLVSHAVHKCVEIKAKIVGEDEREDGKRALLNLGHTVGHAIEHVKGFGKIAHGESVAIGTVAEARLAEVRGECEEPGLAKRIAKLLQRLNLPFSLSGVDVDSLVDAVFMDKKREGAKITLTIPKRIGKVDLIKVDVGELRMAFELLDENKSLVE